MSIDSLADWYGDSFVAHAMNGNVWAFPVVETLHMMAIVLLVGTAAVVDFRLLGWRLKSTPVAELAAGIGPWTLAGFIGVLITGPLLVSTDPDRYIGNFYFRFKMVFLLLSILFDLLVGRRLRAPDSEAGPLQQQLVGGISLLLWTGVLVGGRGIGIF